MLVKFEISGETTVKTPSHYIQYRASIKINYYWRCDKALRNTALCTRLLFTVTKFRGLFNCLVSFEKGLVQN